MLAVAKAGQVFKVWKLASAMYGMYACTGLL